MTDATRAPFVVAGCPARNRAWILPRWHEALQRQTRRPDHALVLLNDCEDQSAVTLEVTRGAHHEAFCRYTVIDTIVPGWHRTGKPRYSSDNLAVLRNRWIAECLFHWPHLTHLWSVDSDVLPAPNCLELLLAADKPIVAAVVRNGDAVYNFWLGNHRRNGHEGQRLKASAPFPVNMTGACVLLRRDVLDAGVRYAGHKQGEDVAFCDQAWEKGFGCWVHPLARTEHIMEGGDNGTR